MLLRDYAMQGELTELVSERDQNFLLQTLDGTRAVLKISSAGERAEVSDFQVRALMHLAARFCELPTPCIIPTANDEPSTTWFFDEAKHAVRLVSYLDGQSMADTCSTEKLAASLGRNLASLDSALADFRHPGDRQVLLWDMQRAAGLRSILSHVHDCDEHAMVKRALDDFELRAAPQFQSLRRQVIHNDVNPGNVLVDPAGQKLAGMIDFGDMLCAPLIVELAIAASYLRELEQDPLRLILPFVAAYHSVAPLQRAEIALLFDLIRTRLATTIAILWWRLAARDTNDPYRQQAATDEAGARLFLERLDTLGRVTCTKRLIEACAL